MKSQEFKNWLYQRTQAELRGFGMEIVEALSSCDRPWGAFLRIDDHSLAQFYEAYWQNIQVPAASDMLRLDPKILIVAPGARLSLQYHHRRSEHWRVLDGPVKIALGQDGNTLQEKVYYPGEVLRIPKTQWHRLIGTDSWGRVAEIWEHTDANAPSDEEDIVRVEDDYGR